MIDQQINFLEYRKKFEFDRSPLIRWQKFNKDIIPLWVADTDFQAPSSVIKAISKRANSGRFGYCSPPKSLNRVIANYCARKYQWTFAENNIVYINNVVAGIAAAILSTTSKNLSVAIPKPIYAPFFKVAASLERKIAYIEYQINNQRLIPDFSQLNTTILKNAKLFLFCHPHNPGSTLFSIDELQKIASASVENNWIVCSDEIHADIILSKNQKHLPLANLPTDKVGDQFHQQVITLMSPNKAYNIPSIGMGFAIISNPTIRSKFKKICEPWHNFNVLTLEAMFAIYEDSDDWLADKIKKLQKNVELCNKWADELSEYITMIIPEATYLVWIKINSPDIFNEFSLEEHFAKFGIGIQDGKIYGSPGFIRLNIATEYSILEEALIRMSKAINAIFKK